MGSTSASSNVPSTGKNAKSSADDLRGLLQTATTKKTSASSPTLSSSDASSSIFATLFSTSAGKSATGSGAASKNIVSNVSGEGKDDASATLRRSSGGTHRVSSPSLLHEILGTSPSAASGSASSKANDTGSSGIPQSSSGRSSRSSLTEGASSPKDIDSVRANAFLKELLQQGHAATSAKADPLVSEVSGGDHSFHDQVVVVSQLKNPVTGALRGSTSGSLISVTRHAVAYVVGDNRLRLIAQDNAAAGLVQLSGMEPGDYVVDVAWRLAGASFLSSSSSGATHKSPLAAPNESRNMIAAISRYGVLSVGIAYAESNSTLGYSPMVVGTSAKSLFGKLTPARGLRWADLSENCPPLLAVFGANNVFLYSVKSDVSGQESFEICARWDIDDDVIEDVAFAADNSHFVVTTRTNVLIYRFASARNFESIAAAVRGGAHLSFALQQSFPLAQDTVRSWIVFAPHPKVGIYCISLDRQGSLYVEPFMFHHYTEDGLKNPQDNHGLELDMSEMLVESMPEFLDALKTLPENLFVAFDAHTQWLCLGSLTFSSIVCLDISDFGNVDFTTGVWENDAMSSISVCATTQLRDVLGGKEAMVLYAYHRNRVALHRFFLDGQMNAPASAAGDLLVHTKKETESAKMGRKLQEEEEAAVVSKTKVDESNVVNSRNRSVLDLNLPSIPKQRSSPTFRASSATARVADAARYEETFAVEEEVVSKIDWQAIAGVVQQEIRTALSPAIAETLGRMERTNSEQLLSASNRAVESIQKSMNKAVSNVSADRIVELITPRIVSELDVKSTLNDMVRSDLLPGLAAVLTEVVSKQLVAPLTTALTESNRQLRKEMETLSASVEGLSKLIKAQQMPTSADISSIVASQLSRHEEQLSQSLEQLKLDVQNCALSCALNVRVEDEDDVELEEADENDDDDVYVDDDVTNDGDGSEYFRDASEGMIDEDEEEDELAPIVALIGMQRDMEALIAALEMADLTILDWVLPQLGNAEEVLLAAAEKSDDSAGALTLAVALSLAQQLGAELSNETELKLQWLAALFEVQSYWGVNANNQLLGESEISVLNELFSNLRVLFAESDPSESFYGQIKDVMRLVRAATTH